MKKYPSIFLVASSVVMCFATSNCTSVSSSFEASPSAKAIQIPYRLPVALVTIKTNKEGVPLMTATMVPDNSVGELYAKYRSNGMFGDDYEIGTNNGLLSAASNISTDTTPQVLENLLTTYLLAAGKLAPGATPAGFVPSGGDASPKSKHPKHLASFLTNNPTQIQTAIDALKKEGIALSVPSQLLGSSKSTIASANLAQRSNALLFRPPTAITMHKENDSNVPVQFIVVPDHTKHYTTSLPRTLGTTRTTTLTINSGMLTKTETNQEGAFATLTAIPITALNKVFSAPKGLLVYEEANNAQIKKVVTSEIALANEREKLRTTLEAIEKAATGIE